MYRSLLMAMLLSVACACAATSFSYTEQALTDAGAIDAPASYGKPLVLLLHGYGNQGGAGIRSKWGISSIDPSRAKVLTPDGSRDSVGGITWNASTSCCQNIQVDDIGRMVSLVQTTLAADPTLDPRRVYVWGHSAGAFMAWRLICARPDVFAAAVIDAGAANTSNDPPCATSPQVSVLHVHGTNDTTVWYDADATLKLGFGYMPDAYVAATRAGGTMEQEARLVGCTGTQHVDLLGAYDHDTAFPSAGVLETDRLSYSGCPLGATAEHWRMRHSGHVPLWVVPAWPNDVLDWSLAHQR